MEKILLNRKQSITALIVFIAITILMCITLIFRKIKKDESVDLLNINNLNVKIVKITRHGRGAVLLIDENKKKYAVICNAKIKSKGKNFSDYYNFCNRSLNPPFNIIKDSKNDTIWIISAYDSLMIVR